MKVPNFRSKSKSELTFEPGPVFKLSQGKPETVERRYCEIINGMMRCRKMTDYECQLEEEVEKLQNALFTITSHYAKIQFRLRQISKASGTERMCLLKELDRMICQGLDGKHAYDELPSLLSDSESMGDVREKQRNIIRQLRGRLENLAEATRDCFQVERSANGELLNRCVCHKLQLRKKRIAAEGDILNDDDDEKHTMKGTCRKKLPSQNFLPQTWAPLGNDTTNDNEKKKGKTSRRSSKTRKSKSKIKSKSSDMLACPEYPDMRKHTPSRQNEFVDFFVDDDETLDKYEKNVGKYGEKHNEKRGIKYGEQSKSNKIKAKLINSEGWPRENRLLNRPDKFLNNVIKRQIISPRGSYASAEMGSMHGPSSRRTSNSLNFTRSIQEGANEEAEDDNVDDLSIIVNYNDEEEEWHTHGPSKSSAHTASTQGQEDSDTPSSSSSSIRSARSTRSSMNSAASQQEQQRSTRSSVKSSTHSIVRPNAEGWILRSPSKNSIYSAPTPEELGLSQEQHSSNASVQTDRSLDTSQAASTSKSSKASSLKRRFWK